MPVLMAARSPAMAAVYCFAKQFVKLYGQLACIIPFNQLEWEKLYWLLKFLIPKLKVTPPGGEEVDALLDSVDLSTYALERVQLNESIQLDADDSELDPESPTIRGYHEEQPEESPLDEIVRIFNERFFSTWDATPEEQRIKLINILNVVKKDKDYETQVLNNPDEQNRRIALESLISNAINHERRRELELYKLYAGDLDFKKALNDSIARILAREKPA